VFIPNSVVFFFLDYSYTFTFMDSQSVPCGK